MPTSVKFPDIAFKFAASRRMNTQSPLNSLLIEIDELTAQPASIYEGEDPLEVNMHGLDKVSDRTFKKFAPSEAQDTSYSGAVDDAQAFSLPVVGVHLLCMFAIGGKRPRTLY